MLRSAHRTLLDVFVILAVSGAILFSNLGAARLWDRDEPRNAGCAREMLARGDWVTPVFDEQLRTAKPVLLYWLIMSATWVFGDGEFSARFWSAVLGVGTALLTYCIGRRLFDRAVAVWAAVVLCSSLMFDVAGRAATPDSTLIFCSTASIAAFVLLAYRDELGVRRWSFWEAFVVYGFMGLGALAKGPVGFVLPTAVIGLFLMCINSTTADQDAANIGRESRFFVSVWWRFRRLLNWSVFWRSFQAMRPGVAVCAILLVALPWYLLVGLRTDGEWLQGFFFQENLGRALQPLENHRGPLFYYLIAISIGFFPWSVFLVPMMLDASRRLFRSDRATNALLLLFCWCAVYVCVFSLAQTKLPSYVTPIYPALALLAANFLYRWKQRSVLCADGWFSVSMAVLGVTGIGFVAAIPLVSREYFPGDGWLGVIGLVLLLGAVLAMWARHFGWRDKAPYFMAGGAVLFVWLLFSVATVRIDRHQHSGHLLASIDRDSERPVVGSFGCLEPSWVYYGRRPIRELTSHVTSKSTNNRQVVSPIQELEKFLAKPDRYVIMTRSTLDAVLDQLSCRLRIVDESPYFLKKDRLVVVTGRFELASRE